MMAFDWGKYIVLAEELGARSEDEAALRSAVSRAYYAAFGKARNHLHQENIHFPKNVSAHTVVWNKFREDAEEHRKVIGTIGDRLRRSRNKADYDDDFFPVASVAQDAILKAKSLIGYLENLNNGQP